MGNRANVVFLSDDERSVSPAVYLHWNGGPESVYAFLDELDARGIRADQNYECARFIQLVGEFFDQDKVGGLSLGVASVNGSASLPIQQRLGLTPTDRGDNGFYVVTRRWALHDKPGKRTVRRFVEGEGIDGMTEIPTAAVSQEHAQALRSATYEGIREWFEKTRGRKPIAEFR